MAASRSEVESAIARMFCVGFDGPRFSDELKEMLDRGVSSIILFSRNYESPVQLAELCWEIKSAADRPIMICIDQEGGRVQRLREPFTIIPSMRELGRRGDVEAARRVGRVLSRELRAVNIDMNLAPVLDVDSNPNNPVIGERSFGSDPSQVAELGRELIDGMQGCDAAPGIAAAGLAACGKHFPGHGDTSVDSHFHLPRLTHDRPRLDAVELPPFRAAIAAGVAAIMCAHVIFDAIDATFPATMSAAVIHDLLRQEMGFDRVVCSDDLEMKAIIDHFGIEQAVVRGAAAGIDLLCVCRDVALQRRAIEALVQAVHRGDVPAGNIERANRRLDALFARFVRPPTRWNEQSVMLFQRLHQASQS